VLCRELKAVFDWQVVGKDRRKRLPDRDCAVAAIAARMGLPAASLSSYMEDQDEDDGDARVKTTEEVTAVAMECMGLSQPAEQPAEQPKDEIGLLDELLDEQAPNLQEDPTPAPRPRKQVHIKTEIELELGDLYTNIMLEGLIPPPSLVAAVSGGSTPLSQAEAEQTLEDARRLLSSA